MLKSVFFTVHALGQDLSYSVDFTVKVLTKFCTKYGSPQNIVIVPTYSHNPIAFQQYITP